MKTSIRYSCFFLLAILLMAFVLPGYSQYAAEIKILPDDGAADDRFGYAVAIDGEFAIIGADQDDDYGSSSGSAYIFRRNAGGDWVLVKKLTASDAASGDIFGRSVAMSGNYAIVGANAGDGNVSNSGSAYVFSRNQGGSDNWGQVAKLTASDGAVYDQFGNSVAMSDDYAIVGAYGDDDNGHDSGSAYIFSRNQGGSDHWGQVTRLTASDGIADQWFGYSVAISGDNAIVGAQGDDDNGSLSGSAYIFSRNQGGSDHWGQLTKLTASDGSAQENFGRSVAIYDDYAIVGAQGDDDNGSASGSAYIFNRNQGGSDHWGEVTKLTASDGAENDQFGFSVALRDEYAIVGAYLDDDNGWDSGSAYIFSRNQGGSDHWGQVTKLTASDGAAEHHFGSSVAICGDYAISGAFRDDDNGDDSGSAYVYGPAPEMDVQGGSPRVSIANGDDTPWHGDGTYFGGTNVGESDAQTFFIYNTGDANLNLTGTPAVQFTGPHAADFYLSTIYYTTIAPGGNTEFDIVFTPSAPGERNATVVIPNNDPDENPYEFAIQGKGLAPEMWVERNGIIADGDMTPSEDDGTDIGSANVGDIKTVNFFIFNEGDGTLYLTARPEVQISGANASDFTFSDITRNEIEPGYQSWFSIQFNPSAPGLRSAIISIPNNDPDENPYDFAIQGTGIAPSDWTEVTPAPSPSDRYWHATAYIGNGQMLMFGGTPGGITGYNDTWLYDIAANTWTNKNPANPPRAHSHGHGLYRRRQGVDVRRHAGDTAIRLQSGRRNLVV